MPETEYFYTSGAGNGFPVCLDKIDIEAVLADEFPLVDYPDGDQEYFWVTLGGYKRSDWVGGTPVTPNQIAISLQRAWQLWWNLNGVTYSGNHSDWNGTYVDETLSIDLAASTWDATRFDPITGLPELDVNKTPKERICFKSYSAERDGANSSSALKLDFPMPSRLYAGSVDDEDNFIGYGYDVYAFRFDVPGVDGAIFGLSCYGFSGWTDPSGTEGYQSNYVNFGAYPFVGSFENLNYVDSPQPGEATITSPSNVPTMTVGTISPPYVITFDSLDLYTPPT